MLQQCLPFTVLKRGKEDDEVNLFKFRVATVLTVYGIETIWKLMVLLLASVLSCNSAYRLRY